jgi:hypothetical protein
VELLEYVHGAAGQAAGGGMTAVRLRTARSSPWCDRVSVVVVADTRSLGCAGQWVRVKMKSYSDPTGLPVAWSSMEPSAPVYLPVPPVMVSVVLVPSSK